MTVPRVDMILDLETLGKEPGAVVLQVGVIAFSYPACEVILPCEVNIDIGSSLLAGMTIDKATLDWWRDQQDEARVSVFRGPSEAITLDAAAGKFMDFWERAGCTEKTRLWVRGADFDPPIWAEALKRGGVKRAPWRYSHVRDIRTALELMGVDRNSVARQGVAHTALSDAGHDLCCLRMALSGVRASEVMSP